MIITERMINACEWKPKISPDLWALQYYYLEKESAVGGGRYDFTYAPHARLPLKIFSEDRIKIMTLQFASQASKTTIGFILLNWFMDRVGGNIMFFIPSDGLVSFVASERVLPAINRTINKESVLFEKTDRSLRDNTKNIRYMGGVVRVLSSSSAMNRKSTPARLIIMDEISEMKPNDVAEISERGKTYELFGGKILKTSTIMHKGDPIDIAYKTSQQQYEYFCKCPYCNKEHIDDLESNLWFPEYKDYKKDDELTEEENKKKYAVWAGKLARYKCPHCEVLWDNENKNKAINSGGWRIVSGDETAKSVGFKCSSFISLFVTLETISTKFLECDTDELKTAFYRGWLNKVYVPKLKVTKKEELLKLKTDNAAGIMPENTIALFSAIDVQDGYYYFITTAFDISLNPHIIDYGRIDNAEALMQHIMRAKYDNVDDTSNIKFPEVFAIDSGFDTANVYDLCYKLNHYFDGNNATLEEKHNLANYRSGLLINVNPIKGSSRSTSNAMGSLFITSRIEKDKDGKALSDPLTLYTINTFYYKDTIANAINASLECVNGIEVFGKKLYLHKDIRTDLCESLVSEHKVEIIAKNGGINYRYDPIKTHPFNHYLDCLVYTLAMADIYNIQWRTAMNKTSANINKGAKVKKPVKDYLDEF